MLSDQTRKVEDLEKNISIKEQTIVSQEAYLKEARDECVNIKMVLAALEEEKVGLEKVTQLSGVLIFPATVPRENKG